MGFVYVLTNAAMAGIVKVGLTRMLPEDRAADLYSTGVPEPFKVVYRALTSWPSQVETRAHEILTKYRVNTGREFFRVPPEKAIEAVRVAAVDVAGIDSWKSSQPHVLQSGDRIALTLEAGQAFVLSGYKDWNGILSREPVTFDLWQAHSDGDLLEISATASASEVAGFSDNDVGSTDDPLPYLDRSREVANGMMIGREKLMPGDRLIWVPGPENEIQECVLFDVRDFCQVVCRTWSPKIDPTYPIALLLNSFCHRGVWPNFQDAMRRALETPVPRTWRPRQERDPEWEEMASSPQPPEYWLPQLKPRSRTRKS